LPDMPRHIRAEATLCETSFDTAAAPSITQSLTPLIKQHTFIQYQIKIPSPVTDSNRRLQLQRLPC
jgi:hypothetical protein